MTSQVDIALKSSGISDVLNALKGVKQSLIEMEKESTSAAKKSSKERLDIIKKEYKEREDLARRAAEVESKLHRGFGRNQNSTRGSTTGSGGFGSLGNVVKIGADTFGFSSTFSTMAKMGAGMAAVQIGFGLLKGGLDLATDALKTFGSFLLNDIVKPELKYDTQYVQMANRSAGEMNAADVKKAVNESNIKWNLDKSEGVKAVAAYGSHGGENSWTDAPKALEFFAMESKRRGTKADIIAESFAKLRMPGESVDDTKKKWLAASTIGDKYDLQIEEMVGVAQNIKGITTGMKGTEHQKFNQTASLLNIMNPFGNVHQNMTSLAGLERDVLKNKKVFKGAISRENGVDLIDMPKALEMILSKSHGGDIQGLRALGIKDARTQRGLNTFKPEYAKAYAEIKANNPGMSEKELEKAAAHQVIEKLNKLSETIVSEDEHRKQAVEVMNTTGEQLESAFNRLKERIVSSGFMDKVESIVNDIINNIDYLSGAAILLTNVFVAAAKLMLDLFADFKDLSGIINSDDNPVEKAIKLADFIDGKTSGGDRIGKNDDNEHLNDLPGVKKPKSKATPGDLINFPPEKNPDGVVVSPVDRSWDKPKSGKSSDSGLKQSSKETSDALVKLTKTVQDLTAKINRLNRDKNFNGGK